MAKRARVSDPSRCDIVRLNVGGKFFDTTSATLKRGSDFFARLLAFGSGTFNNGDKDAEPTEPRGAQEAQLYSLAVCQLV